MREFLQRIHKLLEDLGIPYMLAGSFASSYYGEPRLSKDIDFVIDPSMDKLDQLVEGLKEFTLVQRIGVEQALQTRSLFNVFEIGSVNKADFFFLKNRPFHISEFERRRRITTEGISIFALSPEDCVLSKLVWSKMSDSDLQFRDAVAVLSIQWMNMDKEYLEKWAESLELGEKFEKACKIAEDSYNRRAASNED